MQFMKKKHTQKKVNATLFFYSKKKKAQHYLTYTILKTKYFYLLTHTHT